MLTDDPDELLERCRRAGVVSTPDYPASAETWAKELSILHPTQDAGLLKGRPLLVVHGSDDPYIPADEARVLAEAATGPTDLRVVVRRRPLAACRPRVIAILVGWLERHR